MRELAIQYVGVLWATAQSRRLAIGIIRDARGLAPTLERMGTQIGTDAISGVLKEFWPISKRKWLHKRDTSARRLIEYLLFPRYIYRDLGGTSRCSLTVTLCSPQSPDRLLRLIFRRSTLYF